MHPWLWTSVSAIELPIPALLADRIQSYVKPRHSTTSPTEAVEKKREFAHADRMIRVFCSGMLLISLLIWTGCNSSEVLSSPPATPGKVKGEPQPKLATIQLWLGSQELIAEQALTEDQVQTGMMFRTEMAENEGMLFVFGVAHQAQFWMRNTLVPLSCAFIDPTGVILEVRDMKSLDETPIASKFQNVQYVLETKQGWFERNRVSPGMVVRSERGTLEETYFGKR